MDSLLTGYAETIILSLSYFYSRCSKMLRHVDLPKQSQSTFSFVALNTIILPFVEEMTRHSLNKFLLTFSSKMLIIQDAISYLSLLSN